MSWSDTNNNNPWGSQGGGNGRGQGPDIDQTHIQNSPSPPMLTSKTRSNPYN